MTGVVAWAITGLASAQQQPIYYPAKGQSAQKQQTDTAECQVWAKQTTGVDPVALAQRSAYSPAPPPQGGMLRGAAGGAAAGAAIGAIAGDAGKGAAIGAITGTAGGAMRRHRREEAAAYQQQTMQGSTASQLSTFTRAVTACMNGRGYTSQ
ncbi:glycine zipper domain-containing protein [Burkholderia aenigmatica]|uniref:glycine zipper domain-containing protein n=1 Tax=Burkholderia aenigmatica TaxID=2015348 RepID=UPI001F20A5F7|nr:glycine zipper domain-containing protein [Burkholderia aenigmatica]UKD17194.1 glycine zipper domain-containing protein [Burkholderia aenigmatica]